MPGTCTLILLLIVVALVGMFYLLDGPAEWRRIKAEHAAERKTEEEQQRTEALAKAEADEARKAREEKRAMRREAMTVWSMPDPALFAVPDEAELDRGTIVSGFDGKIHIMLNRSRTETMAWNFHVAPWSVVASGCLATRSRSTSRSQIATCTPTRSTPWCPTPGTIA
jgi:hypothetical protein